jgi:hypothetical protein
MRAMSDDTAALEPGSLRPPTRSGQLATLFWRKEVKLKMRRPLTTLCELLLPALLCSVGIMGARLSDVTHNPEKTFEPADLAAAQATVNPFHVLQQLGIGAAARFAPTGSNFKGSGMPGGVPDLSLWLLTSHFASSLTGGVQRLPPYDGTHLAIVPDIPAVRAVMERTFHNALKWSRMAQMVESFNSSGLLGIDLLSADGPFGDVLGYKGITFSSLDYPLPEVTPPASGSHSSVLSALTPFRDDNTRFGQLILRLPHSSCPPSPPAHKGITFRSLDYPLPEVTTLPLSSAIIPPRLQPASVSCRLRHPSPLPAQQLPPSPHARREITFSSLPFSAPKGTTLPPGSPSCVPAWSATSPLTPHPFF